MSDQEQVVRLQAQTCRLEQELHEAESLNRSLIDALGDTCEMARAWKRAAKIERRHVLSGVLCGGWRRRWCKRRQYSDGLGARQ